MITGSLKFIILNALCAHSQTGYSLMKHIEESTGCYRPSSGSIYPICEEFLASGFVTLRKLGRRKVYTITSAGKVAFKNLAAQRADYIDQMIEGLQIYASFYDKSDMGFYTDMLRKLKDTGEMPFAELSPEINQFRSVLFQLQKDNRINENKILIKRIINKAVADLRGVK